MERQEKNINEAGKASLGENGTLIGIVDGKVAQIDVNKEGGLMSFDNGLSKADINVDGGVTGFNPIGKVEEGDLRAVSGEEVYSEITNTGCINVDGLGNKQSSGYHSKSSARSSLPIIYRKKGVGLQYMTPTGIRTEYFIGDSYSTQNFNFYENTKFNYIYKTGFILNDLGAEQRHDANTIITNFIALDYDIIALNSFNSNNTRQICYVYDANFKYLGVLESENNFSNIIEIKEVLKQDVLSKFNNALYVRFIGRTDAGFSACYKNNPSYIRIVTNDVEKIEDVNYYYDGIYIHKLTGEEMASDGYKSTAFLELKGVNLLVSGFSGVSNNASLICFYDDKMRFISSYNRSVQGSAENVLIEVKDFPIGAKYVRSTALKVDLKAKVEGAVIYFNIKNIQDFTKDYLPNSLLNSNLTRGVRANFEQGGNLKFKNYLGNDQNIHPKVLFFPSKLFGWSFWMAYTPYPNGDVDAENPCIAVSNNGFDWSTPVGLVNPLAYRPNAGSYNNDTHLIYREDTGELECWYREFNTVAVSGKDAIVRMKSKDGINWGNKEFCFDYGSHSGNLLSPCVTFEDGLYKFWCCNNGIKFSESPTGLAGTWTSFLSVNIDLSGITAWHLDVQKIQEKRYFIIQGYTPGNGNNSSDLYVSETNDDLSYTKPELILHRGDLMQDPDYAGIYRSCIIEVYGVFYLYYTGVGFNLKSRTIGLSAGRDIYNLKGVNMP